MSRTIKILAILAVILFCLQVYSDNKAEVDLWGNVGFVNAFPWSANFKYINTFSFTEPLRPWVNHEWLAQYILNFIYINFGNAGLILYKIVVGLAITGLIYIGIRLASCSGVTEFLWIILTISTMGYGFSTRPHLLTYLLYAVFLLILLRYRARGSRYIYILPLLGIPWANLHGAFFIGAILIFIFLIFEISNMKRLIPLAAVIILYIIGTFINPYGPNLWKFIFYSGMIQRPFLSEWAPFTRLEFISEHVDFVFLCLASFLAVSFSRKPKDKAQLVVLSVFFLAAIAMRRNIPLFAITAAFIVPQYLEDTAGKAVKKMYSKFSAPLVAAGLLVFSIVSIVSALTINKSNFIEMEIPQDSFPVNAVSFMKDNGISGNAVIFFNWAEYCIWKLYPDCRVFLDGRLCCAYNVKTINDFFNFLYARGDWQRAIRDYSADIVLIHRGNPAYAKMLTMPGWTNIYNDRIAGLFLKKMAHEAFILRLQKGDVKYPQLKENEYFP